MVNTIDMVDFPWRFVSFGRVQMLTNKNITRKSCIWNTYSLKKPLVETWMPPISQRTNRFGCHLFFRQNSRNGRITSKCWHQFGDHAVFFWGNKAPVQLATPVPTSSVVDLAALNFIDLAAVAFKELTVFLYKKHFPGSLLLHCWVVQTNLKNFTLPNLSWIFGSFMNLDVTNIGSSSFESSLNPGKFGCPNKRFPSRIPNELRSVISKLMSWGCSTSRLGIILGGWFVPTSEDEKDEKSLRKKNKLLGPQNGRIFVWKLDRKLIYRL